MVQPAKNDACLFKASPIISIDYLLNFAQDKRLQVLILSKIHHGIGNKHAQTWIHIIQQPSQRSDIILISTIDKCLGAPPPHIHVAAINRRTDMRKDQFVVNPIKMPERE